MHLHETSLSNIAGRKFKLILRKLTGTTIGSAAEGAITTGVLQSSSVVSAMIIAFAWAGVFTLKSALSAILGASLGTTLDSWLIASVGISADIDILSYSVILIGGLIVILSGKNRRLVSISYFLLGFDLLFIGLYYMKNAFIEYASHFNFSKLMGMPPIYFLLIGFILTVLIQSGSATMAITLSALRGGAFDLFAASIIVLGSQTGTILKLYLNTINGNVLKKEVVTGSLIFNAVLPVAGDIFLKPFLYLIRETLHIDDKLIALVTFYNTA